MTHRFLILYVMREYIMGRKRNARGQFRQSRMHEKAIDRVVSPLDVLNRFVGKADTKMGRADEKAAQVALLQAVTGLVGVVAATFYLPVWVVWLAVALIISLFE